LSLDRAEVEELVGSMSHAGVYRVRLGSADAVLKVTEGDARQRVDARRELSFYLELAGSVPVSTPRLLATADGGQLTALLLSAHTPVAPAARWERCEWLAATRQLARLHAFEVPREDPWVHVPWVRGVLQDPPTDLAIDYWSQTVAAHHIDSLLRDPASLARALDDGPMGFIHGDCHVDNLLRDGDQLIWADWQVAGTGNRAVDLAFLYGRGYADGANPPLEHMLEEYLVDSHVEAAQLLRSMMAAELATLLFGWPTYMTYHTQEERDRMTSRLVQLADSWLS